MTMNELSDIILENDRVKLIPLTLEHVDSLQVAAADGKLWENRVTSVPTADKTLEYIEWALTQKEAGTRMPFAVWDKKANCVIGTTGYHDILAAVARLEIGYTWYAQSYQRSYVNTSCKYLLLQYAFETLGVAVVGWRTDNFNFASQKAIERLGAKKDGVLRGHALRRDGTVRDTVFYSVTKGEWPEIKAHLAFLMHKYD